MRVHARAYWLPKADNPREDYEDAFWPESHIDRAVGRFRCAVADGATETSFSRLWAQMLVQAWGLGRLGRRNFRTMIPYLQLRWLAEVSVRPLPWYAEAKLRSGAFAALMGLHIADVRKGSSNSWHALGVGDACLFQLREGELITSFPLTRADQFEVRPWLLSSNSGQVDEVVDHVCTTTGRWRTGDSFYLMTDALACWFLTTCSDGTDLDVLTECDAPGDADGFAARIGELRDAGRLRNDDVTLLRVDVE